MKYYKTQEIIRKSPANRRFDNVAYLRHAILVLMFLTKLASPTSWGWFNNESLKLAPAGLKPCIIATLKF